MPRRLWVINWAFKTTVMALFGFLMVGYLPGCNYRKVNIDIVRASLRLSTSENFPGVFHILQQ